jgi:hypothetical protein
MIMLLLSSSSTLPLLSSFCISFCRPPPPIVFQIPTPHSDYPLLLLPSIHPLNTSHNFQAHHHHQACFNNSHIYHKCTSKPPNQNSPTHTHTLFPAISFFFQSKTLRYAQHHSDFVSFSPHFFSVSFSFSHWSCFVRIWFPIVFAMCFFYSFEQYMLSFPSCDMTP